MKRALALCFATLAVGCGTDSSKPQDTGPNPAAPSVEIPGYHVSNGLLSLSATTAKVAVKTTRTEPQIQYDDNSGGPLTCGTATDCGITGAECTNGMCTVSVTTTTPFYMRNYPVTAGVVSFPIPCDGNLYAAEVYGAVLVGGVQQITDAEVASAIQIATDCTATTPASWSAIPRPTLNVPTIYVGIPAPYNTYSVTSSNYAYPWTGSFGMTANGLPATSAANGTATFPSPATVGDISFAATYHLSPSLVTAGESWDVVVAGVGHPLGNYQVPGP